MGNLIGATIFFTVLAIGLYVNRDVKGSIFGNPNERQDKENAKRLKRWEREL